MTAELFATLALKSRLYIIRDEYDFSRAKRGPVVPLPPHQTEARLRLDNDILNWLREQVNKADGGSYQDLLNSILRAHIQGKEGSPFVQANREGQQSEDVHREEVFAVLQGRE